MSGAFDAELYEYLGSEPLSVTTSPQSTTMRLEPGFVYLLATVGPMYFRTDGSDAGAAVAGSHLLGTSGFVPLPGTDRASTLSYIASTATTATLSKLRKVCV